MSTRNLTEPKKQALRDAFVKVLANTGITNLDFDLADFLDRGRAVTDVWVDGTNGNDDFEGFQGRPFKTLSRAAKEINSEQYSPLTIHIKRGTYVDVVKVISSSVHPITFQGEDFDLFSPTSGLWTAAGTLSSPRYFHRTVLLNDGRVLTAGGVTSGGPTPTVEIYNPSTNAWTAAASMSTDRYAFQLVTLADGRVLACGGVGNGLPALDTAEIYDPVANNWTAIGTMATARQGAGVVLLNDGSVLVAGGNDGIGPLSTAEIYDTENNLWKNITSMSRTHYAGAISLLSDGKVLVAGGATSLPGAEVYDPINNVWVDTENMIEMTRVFVNANKVPDGRVILAGGNGDSGNLDTTEIYNPTTNTWIAGPVLSTKRGQSSTAVLLDGKVLIAGGGDAVAVATSETYNPDLTLINEPWVASGTLASIRQMATATRLTDGTVILVGGQGGAGALVAVAERYSPSSSTASGTIASYTSPTATVTGASWPINNLKGKLLRIKSGAFDGNMYPIHSNTGNTMDIGCGDAIGGAVFDLVTPAVIIKKNTVDDASSLGSAIFHSVIHSPGSMQTVNVTPLPYGLVLKNLWLSSDSSNVTKYFIQNSGVVSLQNCVVTQSDSGSIGGGTWVVNSDGIGNTVYLSNTYINTPRLHRSQFSGGYSYFVKNLVFISSTNNNCFEFDGGGSAGLYISGPIVVDCGSTGIFLNNKGGDTNVKQVGGVYVKNCSTAIAAFGKMTWHGLGDFIITNATSHGIEIRQNAFWSSAGTALSFGTGAFSILTAGQDGIRVGASHCFVGLQYANPTTIQNCGGWGIKMGEKGNSTQGNTSRFNLVQMPGNANITMSGNTSGDMTVDGTTVTSQADLNAAPDKTIIGSTLQNVILMTA